MTTTVTIKTADCSVRLSTYPMVDGAPVADAEWQTQEVVGPNRERTVYVHANADLLVQELPIPKA